MFGNWLNLTADEDDAEITIIPKCHDDMGYIPADEDFAANETGELLSADESIMDEVGR